MPGEVDPLPLLSAICRFDRFYQSTVVVRFGVTPPPVVNSWCCTSQGMGVEIDEIGK